MLSYSQENLIKLDNLQVSTAKKKKKKDKNKKPILNYYMCGKPGHIAKNYKSKNKVQRPQFNILLIEPLLDDSNEDNISPPENNHKRSAGSLQQPKETDSQKKGKHLEFYKKGQQVPYWI